MNKTSKRTWTSVFIAVIMLCAVLLGGQMITLGGDAAPTSDVTVEFAANKPGDTPGTEVEVLPGDKVEIGLTISTTQSAMYWEAVSLTLCVVAKVDAATLAEQSSIDKDLSKKLSCVQPTRGKAISFIGDIIEKDEYDELLYQYSNSSADLLQGALDATRYVGILFSMARPADEYLLPCNSTVQFTTTIQIANDFPADVSEFYLALLTTKRNAVTLVDSSDVSHEYLASTSSQLTANNLHIKVRQPSDNAKLEKLWLGNTTDLDLIFDSQDVADGETFTYVYSYTYDFPGPALTDFTVKAIPEDENATMKVAFSPIPSNALASDTPLTLTISTANDPIKLYIEVTSEKGTTQMYDITVNLAFVSLQDLTATTDSPTTTATKNGMDTTTPFAPDTLEYTVFVPTDYTKVTVTPTVMADIGAKEDIALTPTLCTITPTGTVRSGSSVEVTNLEAGSTLELTATASDNTTTKTYKLVFQLVSVDTSLTVNSVVGVVTGTTFTPETAPAGVTVDYYYVLVGETNGEATVTLTAAATSTIDIGGTAYAAPTVCKGDITITVTAEAGNTKSYTMSFATLLYLQVEDSSKYQFLTEVSSVDASGDDNYHRRAYGELGWEHGKDDLTLSHVFVLGQVLPTTTVNEFLNNILAAQRPLIKLYNQKGDLVSDGGNPASGYTSPDFDDNDVLSVASGWVVKYGADEDTADTVYVSVLGDVTCDGMVDSRDAAKINSYLTNTIVFDDVIVRLSAYVRNTGMIDSRDVAALNSYIMNVDPMEKYFYLPTTTTP